MGLWIALGVVAVILLWAVSSYNGLVRLKNRMKNAWAQIEVQLKRRHDLIPNLVETATGYMKHERRTLEAVIKARSMTAGAGTDGEVINAQNAITDALKSLFAVVENYPNLKADASFRQLQSRISEIEDQIADRREFYNDSVNLYNIRIEQVPDVLVAKTFNFGGRTLWEIVPEHRADVEIKINRDI